MDPEGRLTERIALDDIVAEPAARQVIITSRIAR
jgi:hypothetical protein